MVAYSTNYYKIFENGCQRDFIRTEKGFSEITGCRILTDNEIANRDGLVPDAVRISDSYIAELVAQNKSTKAKVRRSKIRRFQKGVV